MKREKQMKMSAQERRRKEEGGFQRSRPLIPRRHLERRKRRRKRERRGERRDLFAFSLLDGCATWREIVFPFVLLLPILTYFPLFFPFDASAAAGSPSSSFLLLAKCLSLLLTAN